MARTTVAEVREILPASTLLTDVQIQAAIDAATCVIDQVALFCGSSLSEACLTQAERYLAAHYAAATENTLSLSSETDACSESKVVYGFKFGEGVMGTPYGQMANTLTSGCLKDLEKPKAAMFSIGCA